MSQDKRRDRIEQEFVGRYGSQPTLLARAPGRVDLMGSHTDYNEGFVLTMTIDREVWIAARPRPDRKVRIGSLNIAGSGAFGLDDIQRDSVVPWTNYVRGVAHVAGGQGLPLVGFDGLIHSTVPVASGVSSSAALEVATAMVFQRLGQWSITPVELALLCQKAENQFVGMNCGILDQYSSTMGQADCAILLDCRHLTHEATPLDPDIGVVISDTRAKRELTGSEYPERRAQCEEGARILRRFTPTVRTLRDMTLAQFEAHADALPETVRRRCRFVIEENQRVLDMSQAVRQDRERISALCAASYAGARDLYEIVSREMEAMMAAMLSGPGIVGARQAGAGFGGCMVACVRREAIPAFVEHVAQGYASATGITPDVYPVRPVAGAGLLTIEGTP